MNSRVAMASRPGFASHMDYVLFVCTGNYYRSRYAQAVFNHIAQPLGLEWEAFSRGLDISAVFEPNELSVHTAEALRLEGIPLALAGERRTALTETDLRRASITIALKRDEHLAMMKDQFPGFADRINYWDIHDLDGYRPEEALPLIRERVEKLLQTLIPVGA